jgi:hypothetical protein
VRECAQHTHLSASRVNIIDLFIFFVRVFFSCSCVCEVHVHMTDANSRAGSIRGESATDSMHPAHLRLSTRGRGFRTEAYGVCEESCITLVFRAVHHHHFGRPAFKAKPGDAPLASGRDEICFLDLLPSNSLSF